MAILKLVKYPHKALRQRSAMVSEIDKNFLDDMMETMTYHKCIGFSAPQVGVNLRVFVMNIENPFYAVNPELIEFSNTVNICGESSPCIDGIGHVEIRRNNSIKIEYLDYDGKERFSEFSGLEARCILHQLDHLDGKLIIDHLPMHRKERFLKQIKKKKA